MSARKTAMCLLTKGFSLRAENARAFFKFTLIYIAIEYTLLNIRIDGINLISQELYQTLYSILTPDGSTIDYRHQDSWWTYRSGGYLADPLAMPVLVLYRELAFLDTRIGLILLYTLTVLPIVIWIMRDQFNAVPIELEEAAHVDGASVCVSFFRIVLRLFAPA